MSRKNIEISQGPEAAASVGLDAAAMQKVEELGDYLRQRGFLLSAEIVLSEDMRGAVMKLRGDADRDTNRNTNKPELALVVYYNFDAAGQNQSANAAKMLMHQVALLRIQIDAANANEASAPEEFEAHMAQHGEDHMREHHPEAYAIWLEQRMNAAKNASRQRGKEMTEEELKNLPVTERYKN